MTQETKPKEESKTEIPVIRYLKNLVAKQDRAALAHLRRGLGQRPGESMEMYPYVGRFVNEATNESYDRAVFLTAALFAGYPDAGQNVGDLGRSIRLLADKSDSIERRFVALLDAEAVDLHHYLRQMVSLLKTNSIAVNWEQLFKDIRAWSSEKRFVQRNWARSFWGSTDTNNLDRQEKGE